MPLVIKDRVRETSTTTGTGTLTLLGAVSSYQSFAGIGDGNTCYYCILLGTDWEVGLGTYAAAGATLARTVVLASSNAGALVNFGAGTKDVFSQFPAAISPTLIGNNAVINGDFDIWQRGTSFAAIASGSYSADRWSTFLVGAAVYTIARDTSVPTLAQSGCLSNYSLKLSVTTIDAAIAAGDFVMLTQKMEGYVFKRLAQKSITVSFWVRAFKTGIYCFRLCNSGADRSYVAEYTINASDTWEKKTITIPASPSAGTWDYTNGIGLFVTFTLACGSTYQTTAGAWQTGNFLGTANQVNGVDSTSNTFYLSQVKLEAGEVATPFESRPFEEELASCQRYYQKTFEYTTAPAQNLGIHLAGTLTAVADSTTAMEATWFLKVQMRTLPTVTTYNPSVANVNWRNTANTDTSTVNDTIASETSVTIRGGDNLVDNYYEISATADAEL